MLRASSSRLAPRAWTACCHVLSSLTGWSCDASSMAAASSPITSSMAFSLEISSTSLLGLSPEISSTWHDVLLCSPAAPPQRDLAEACLGRCGVPSNMHTCGSGAIALLVPAMAGSLLSCEAQGSPPGNKASTPVAAANAGKSKMPKCDGPRLSQSPRKSDGQ